MYYGLLCLAAKTVSGYDPDAQAFFTAASITDTTQKDAVNQLVLDLKSYSIWSKMKALYPFVGGTASTHKYNLKDPQDTDAAFRLIFSGGWTHSSTGAKPNGTNGYADTKLRAYNNLSISSSHISSYVRTTPNNGVIIGHGSFDLLSQISSGVYYGSLATSSYSSTTQSNTTGFYMVNRPNSTNQKLIKNSTILLNDSKLNLGYANTLDVILSSYEKTSTFSDAELSLASIGEGLTDTEAANFYTAVQAFQTTLSRQVI